MSEPRYFASWVQPAAVAALPHDDANTRPTQPADSPSDPTLDVGLELTNNLGASQSVLAPYAAMRVLGPGDVIGIDATQIVRRYPAPATGGAETTHLACIDFAATDLPWRFSPATATPTTPAGIGSAENRLRPWLVLLAVTADLALSDGAIGPEIAVPPDQLPDLEQSWAWAHAQLDDPTDCSGGRSRLLCPRQLPSNVAMRAILVPAFAAGVASGLGLPNPIMTRAPGNLEIPTPGAVYEPAWRNPTAPVILPVYDQWTFTTGDGLDFATLAERITPANPDAIAGFGSLIVDVGGPLITDGTAPDPAPPPAPVPVDTALGPIAPRALNPGQQTALNDCAQQVVDYINNAVAHHTLCPPIRGGYHIPHGPLDPASSAWLDTANRDPRRRLAAGRGADWVNANQDDLMTQAWQQAGQVRAATRQLSAARAASAITDSLHRRHVLPLSVDEAMRLNAPAAQQLPVAGVISTLNSTPPSVADILAASAAPNGLGTTRFARLVRTLAAARAAGTGSFLSSKAMTGALLGAPGVSTLSPTAASPAGAVGGLQILVGAYPATKTRDVLAQQWRRVSSLTVAPSTTAPFAAITITGGGTDQRPLPAVATGLSALTITGAAASTLWGSTPSPAAAVAARASIQLRRASGGPAVNAGLQPALATPQVGAPLALALLERDPDWLVAGASTFPDDCATLLQPIPEAIEAIFLGANYAMLDEYLWRGFPTDRRGTPIRRFWPTTDPTHVDIPPIDRWTPASLLGAHFVGGSTTLTMLMLRSELFERYPDMVIAAVPAQMTAHGPTPDSSKPFVAPAFPMIAINARTRILGFAGIDPATLSAQPSTSAPGWYFVLIEPPTGLRFGFDSWPAPHAFLDNPFGENFSTSADLAAAAVQPPARVFLHSARMVGRPA